MNKKYENKRRFSVHNAISCAIGCGAGGAMIGSMGGNIWATLIGVAGVIFGLWQGGKV